MSGLYIHIPFCRQACHYCNFHFSTSLKMKERMMMNICSEIQQRQNYLKDRNLTSIYLGGGTPSVLTGQELNQLFDTIHTYFDWDLSAEITLEANPDDLSTDYLSMLRSTPVNRLSIGIQSRDDHQLKWMNRSHNASQGLGAIENALQKGFDQMTIDWIYGLPGLSDADWVESLQWMENLRIPHFSAYALTVEEHTALAYQIRKGRTEIPPDKSVVRQFDLLLDWADSSIYEQYEISNFSIPGHQAVHNSQYWTAVPYLGVGPSAHSFNGRQRHWNLANNTSYMKSIESGKLPLRSEPFRLIDRVNERIMTALRLSRGLSWAAFEKDYPTYLGPLKQRVQSHPEDHWWIRTQDFVKLSRAGMHYADRAAADLFFD
jgi:oxygen-independent coproporphyrinogen-3 oxidase